MEGSKLSSSAEIPEGPSSTEVADQLQHSRSVRDEVEVKRQRAEETAGEMSRILRRIAEAIDRNPQSWDSLFIERRGQ